MTSYAMVMPILPGKLDAWKAFARSLGSDKKSQFDASRQKLGIRKEMAWHQATPHGDMVILYMELSGSPQELMARMMQPSQDPFDVWFMEQLQDVHGFDPAQAEGPIPLNELVFSWTTLLERVGDTAADVSYSVAGTTASLLNKAGETATEVGEVVKTKASAFMSEAGEKAADVGQNVADTASHLAGKAGETASSLFGKAMSLFDKDEKDGKKEDKDKD